MLQEEAVINEGNSDIYVRVCSIRVRIQASMYHLIYFYISKDRVARLRCSTGGERETKMFSGADMTMESIEIQHSCEVFLQLRLLQSSKTKMNKMFKPHSKGCVNQ